MRPTLTPDLGATRDSVTVAPAPPHPPRERHAGNNVRDARTEKMVEHSGDLLMSSLGFEVVRFSQARATMQTPGIPDRLYVSIARKLGVFWEAKAWNGRQSDSQRWFQSLVTASSCSWHYVVGTDDDLTTWLVERGIVRRLPNGLEVVGRPP